MTATSSPHHFSPQKVRDAFLFDRYAVCRHCLLPRSVHPVHFWAPAREAFDRTRPNLSWETLHSEGA